MSSASFAASSFVASFPSFASAQERRIASAIVTLRALRISHALFIMSALLYFFIGSPSCGLLSGVFP